MDTLLFLLVHPVEDGIFQQSCLLGNLKGKTRATTRSAKLAEASYSVPGSGPDTRTPAERRREQLVRMRPLGPLHPRGSPGGQAEAEAEGQLMGLPGWLRSQDLPEAASGPVWDGLVIASRPH